MNCQTCQKWLHLYKDEELTSHQKRLVEKHCDQCADCQKIMHQIVRMDKSVSKVSQNTPTLKKPELFTDQVMQAVRQDSIKNRSAFHFNWLYFLNRPSMRLAFGCALLLITTFFFYQEVTIMHRVTILEGKIESVTPIPKSTLGQCLSSLGQFEKSFLNGNLQQLISQAREGSIPKSLLIYYSKKFQTLSPVNQLKIIRLCHLAQERSNYVKLYSRLEANFGNGGFNEN